MERREVLTVMGSLGTVAVSGCLGSATGNNSRSLTITTVDQPPEPLSFEVSVSEAELSSETMPTLEISAENTGEDTVSWPYTGQIGNLPFPQGRHDASNGVLVIGLQEEVRAQLMDVSDGCSRVNSFLTADGIQTTSLGSGDRVRETYATVGVNQELNGNCPDTGTYRMENEMGDLGTWGFKFRLE